MNSSYSVFLRHKQLPWWLNYIGKRAVAAFASGFSVAAAVDNYEAKSSALFGMFDFLIEINHEEHNLN